MRQSQESHSEGNNWISSGTDLHPWGVLPNKGLMGTCGQPGYVFRVFFLNRVLILSFFVLIRVSFFWTINSLRVCSTNVVIRVSQIRILS